VKIDITKDPEKAVALIEHFKIEAPTGQITQIDHMWIGQHTFRTDQPVRRFQIHLPGLKQSISSNNLQFLKPHFIAPYTVRLDGRTRFALANDYPSGDIKKSPENHLWALFENDDAREKARKITEEAFGLYFVIDPTPMQKFSIRLSERPPADSSEEQALDQRARDFHANATHILDFSDGVQAFVGLISAILSLEHKIILIDEPEAFLHPSLARLLASNMGEIAKKREASLIVSTHSAEFLIGCLEKVDDVSVVRLTYKDKIATARELNHADLKEMMRDPLLRSTKTLEGLFHNAVIISESDTDRAFYDEINRRLQPSRGIGQALFINGQNKQTVHRILNPLRKIGVPAVGIVDLDMIKEKGTNWVNLLSAAGIPTEEQVILEKLRSDIANEFETLPLLSGGHEQMKKIGIDALNENKASALELIKRLAEYGIFLVSKGEVECWLSSLGARGHGADWLIDIFAKIGSDETTANYILPGKDDVWKFIDDIGSWTGNPKRKGMILNPTRLKVETSEV